MTTDEAQAAIATVVTATKGKFKPLGEPTLTPRGASIEFERVTVSPDTVCNWFTDCGYLVTMIAYDGVYSKQPFMVLEWR